MGKTYKHKDQAKFKNGIIPYEEVCQSTKDMGDRHNSERGEFSAIKKQITEKILDKELPKQLEEQTLSNAEYFETMIKFEEGEYIKFDQLGIDDLIN